MIDVYDEKIGRLQDQQRELIYDHDKLRQWIDAAELTVKEYDYLHLRYVEHMTTADIADRQGYSERHIERIKRSLLKKLVF